MLSRRAFLKASVAAASGLILPSWLVRAENFLKVEGKPLLESLPTHRQTLYVSGSCGDGLHTLGLEDCPYDLIDVDLTWKEFIEEIEEGQEEFDQLLEQRAEYGEALLLDEKIDADLFYGYWDASYSPEAKAHGLLSNLDLGPELIGEHARGGIYVETQASSWGYRSIAAAEDELSLSLLQKRLNDIDGTIAIELE
ncbi:MAG: hypothetical protein DRQ61_07115 [Gammaproteobacteria bacterium]|nr:MAG: hypothetical protein DRQ61_07115 [Gammaproteobacteria bacterium]